MRFHFGSVVHFYMCSTVFEKHNIIRLGGRANYCLFYMFLVKKAADEHYETHEQIRNSNGNYTCAAQENLLSHCQFSICATYDELSWRHAIETD